MLFPNEVLSCSWTENKHTTVMTNKVCVNSMFFYSLFPTLSPEHSQGTPPELPQAQSMENSMRIKLSNTGITIIHSRYQGKRIKWRRSIWSWMWRDGWVHVFICCNRNYFYFTHLPLSTVNCSLSCSSAEANNK